ncbi:Na+/H+ antiporter NhaA [Solicola sp. PLA-1-18]|uniref:Na+/H+ antiporter NhaA n=1 Tax=Solicola sp. PLA-1-18 TaxID=3380532 RepID=UPI003B785580
MNEPSSLPTRPGPETRVRLPVAAPAVRRFMATESGGAVLLLGATVLALLWANSPWWETYEQVWGTHAGLGIGDVALDLSLRHWVNDALMAIFFLVVGLEISREVWVGDLRNPRTVAVPALGAVGGMLLPALIYLAFNPSGPEAAGWGMAMSTDTAFLLGVLALFGPRCPDHLRLFLLTLAIVDDIGAIAVMAVFYNDGLQLGALTIAVVLAALLVLMRRAGVWQVTPYAIVGLGLWLAVHESGVHATIAGVVIGLAVPAALIDKKQRDRMTFYVNALQERAAPDRAQLTISAARATISTNGRMQYALHPVSAFVVVPLFGLANAGVHLDGPTLAAAATSSITIGIAVALVLGNAVGISVFSAVALRSGLGDLPGRVRYGHLMGGAVLAGIGFTISLFIAELAFDDAALRDQAKIGILTGSLLAAVLGSVLLRTLGERLPMCTPDGDGMRWPELPPRPWRAPTG